MNPRRSNPAERAASQTDINCVQSLDDSPAGTSRVWTEIPADRSEASTRDAYRGRTEESVTNSARPDRPAPTQARPTSSNRPEPMQIG